MDMQIIPPELFKQMVDNHPEPPLNCENSIIRGVHLTETWVNWAFFGTACLKTAFSSTAGSTTYTFVIVSSKIVFLRKAVGRTPFLVHVGSPKRPSRTVGLIRSCFLKSMRHTPILQAAIFLGPCLRTLISAR